MDVRAPDVVTVTPKQPTNNELAPLLEQQESEVANNPDSLINIYKRTNAQDRQRLLTVMNTNELKALYEFYITEMNDAVSRFEINNHPSKDIARDLYNEIDTLRMQKFSGKRFCEFNDKDLFAAIHNSIALMNTVKPGNLVDLQDFNDVNQNFTAAANEINRQGKSHRINGGLAALQITIMMAAIIGICVSSVITAGFSLMMLPMIIGGAGLMGLLSIPTGIQAHSFFTQGKKERALADHLINFSESMTSPQPKN